MNITAKLREHLLAKGWIVADAPDATVKSVVGAKLVSGELPATEFAELTKADKPPLSKSVEDLIAKAVETALAAVPKPPPGVTAEDIDKIVEKRVAEAQTKAGGGMVGLLARSSEYLGSQVRVKEAVEKYGTTKSAAVYPAKTALGTPHAFAGQPAQYGGIPLDIPSERDKAVAGVVLKWQLEKGNDPRDIPYSLRMRDHDREILYWALKNSKWTGQINSNPFSDADFDTQNMVTVNRRKLEDVEVKALLDDVTSGGIEITPIEFDDALVTTPVLYGEFFPLVTVIPVARGRRMKGGSISNPTFVSGVAEGTAIQPFNTSSFVGAFDTPIFTAVGAMEIGLDFEDDSPTNVGATIMAKYGEKSLEWLDRVVPVGDGVTEPQGFFNSSGITGVTSDFSVNGPSTVGDYEALMFAVGKAFRNTKGAKNIYAGSDTSYRRARGIARGPGDQQRIFGMNHLDYTLLGRDYKISNSIPNSKIGFINMGYYRMYRRLGMSARVETGGQALALRNTRLIVVRMRYGGQMELGGAAAAINDAPL